MAKAQNVKTPSTPLVRASARQLRIAPRKMRLTTNLVKGMNALDAMTQLEHTNKKAAPILIKLIQSAVANAKNNFSLDPQHLFIKSISTDQGQVMRRYMARARGSASPIRRKLSHVNIILEERKQAKASKARLGFLNREKKEEKPENVDQQQAAEKQAPKETGKKPQLFSKSEEQQKQNTVANKRRLFNRKSGE